MTTSTDNKKEIIKKPQGPIRWGAIVPFTVIVILCALYGKFFLDSHLRSAMEWGATKTHRAEVNIGDVKTSFFNGTFLISGLQVTNKENPAENLIEVGQMRFSFLWDALLRAKFVVEDAGIENIQANTKRKKPGKILPEEPVAPQAKNENVELAKKTAVNQAKKEFSQNALGDIASIIGGASEKDQLKQIQGELKSEQRIKEIEAELKVKEEEWKKAIDSLPKSEDFDAISKRSKEINLKEKNPLKLLKEVKKMKNLVKETKDKVKAFKDASKKLKDDVKRYSNITKEIDDLVKEDMKSLQDRMKVPDIDFGDFAMKVFGQMFSEKAAGVKKYADMAKKYMPEKKTAEEIAAAKAAQPKARKRGEGKLYQFPITTGYPLFWLKKGTISSKSTPSIPMSGDIEGRILNLSSDPKYIGKPGLITFSGDFPNQNIKGVEGQITLNHHLKGKPANQKFAMEVKSFPVGGKTLSKSSALSIGFKKAVGSVSSFGTLEEGKVMLSMNNAFNEIDYEIDAKNKHVKEIFTGVLKDTPKVYVKANATGKWGDLDWKINSNLADDLKNGLQKQVNAKIAAEKQKIKDKIDAKIGPKKKELESKLAKAKGKVDELINKNKSKVDEAEKKMTGKLAQAEKKSKDSGKKKAQDNLKKAFKKFKFKL